MAELKRCFAALGFTETPRTAAEIEAQYAARLAHFDGSRTESDALARQLLAENRALCLAALGKG